MASPAGLPEPIVAIATAAGRGAVGIVRASGLDLQPLISAVCGRPLLPRVATLLSFIGDTGEALDRGLAIHFPAPHSVTGEDVLELQCHGGPVLLQLLQSRCLNALPGLRLARPGEFTERAFLNDKIDLAQAEAVADLIDASTEAAARSAARSLSGAFSAEIDALAERIVQLRTLVEATLDFPEEEIDFLERAGARQRLFDISTTLDAALGRARQGALLREGVEVVLAGQTNVGKSSLLNLLAGAELAIVTPIAGTTRDRVSQTIQIEGVPLHIVDTAGLRGDAEAVDTVERIGIGRSWESIGNADVVLWLRDLERIGEPGYDAADRSLAVQMPAGVPVLQVFNKRDCTGAAGSGIDAAALRLCALTGEGLDAVRSAVLEAVGWQPSPEGVTIARARHVQALRVAQVHLAQAQSEVSRPDPALELLAEELRLAHRSLSEITGAFSNEDLLGEIFGRFCIGK
ncbi:MAG: tRNA uridine-5-carboxymethylaminomethyl(34) synthesis GTPase MnmE [Pseudomonadota bacterium]|nr:tRNA uridine-5-carboxymethylaminomethyl(34) synthesis GTPase MnmE [Pseudomonadota bacterium]